MKKISVLFAFVVIFGCFAGVANAASIFNTHKMVRLENTGSYEKAFFVPATIGKFENTGMIEVCVVSVLSKEGMKEYRKFCNGKTPKYVLQKIVLDYENERYNPVTIALCDKNERILVEESNTAPWGNFVTSPMIQELALRVAKIVTSI